MEAIVMGLLIMLVIIYPSSLFLAYQIGRSKGITQALAANRRTLDKGHACRDDD
jgi:hypothetical protein